MSHDLKLYLHLSSFVIYNNVVVHWLFILTENLVEIISDLFFFVKKIFIDINGLLPSLFYNMTKDIDINITQRFYPSISYLQMKNK
jgi:hypothetical protein